MIPNNTRYTIDRAHDNSRWEVICPHSGETICHSATYAGAVKAAQELERNELSPVAEANVATRSFRETFRCEHFGKVMAARLRKQASV